MDIETIMTIIATAFFSGIGTAVASYYTTKTVKKIDKIRKVKGKHSRLRRNIKVC